MVASDTLAADENAVAADTVAAGENVGSWYGLWLSVTILYYQVGTPFVFLLFVSFFTFSVADMCFGAPTL